MKKKRKIIHDQVKQPLKKFDLLEWLSEEYGDTQEMPPIQDMSTPQVISCVLYHPYISVDARNTCTPNHWHATYWLRFVTLIEQEPRRAIVQHTDTKRYHLMIQVPVEHPLPCDSCITPHEIFRLPVQDHYAYFVFIPQQDLDGFASLQQAQEAAQTLSLPPNIYPQITAP
ncbi:hypothetical protein KDK_60500 [Dictyobacter kobayashii]|uniref:Uncharacterized protein n=1 Tax=Dictyobacter kobayashii TaxID=2014872 RepID=A0A402ASZ7_9CHLR|nr:hypothetical protein KDK_60500 [Dictyobacter kobayashii]